MHYWFIFGWQDTICFPLSGKMFFVIYWQETVCFSLNGKTRFVFRLGARYDLVFIWGQDMIWFFTEWQDMICFSFGSKTIGFSSGKI